MNIYKKDIAKAATTVLLVALLSVASYYLFPESIPTVTFAFAFVKTNEPFPDLDLPLGESVLVPVLLNTEFRLRNGSTISLPIETYEPTSPFNWTEYISGSYAPSYQGDFNGTLLEKIKVCDSGRQPSGAFVSPDISYNITYVRHRIFNSSLKIGEDATDMGIYGWWDSYFLYRKGMRGGGHGLWGHEDDEIGATEYWSYFGSHWTIYTNQLSSLLQGSGTAILEFNGIISWDINYTLVTANGSEAGEETVNWEGTLGTIEITYDQGTILWVKYDFTGIVLLMLPVGL